MPSKHAQLPSALAGTPLLPVARGGAPSPRPAFGAARGDLEATFRRPHDPPRRPGREFASGEGAEKVLIEANDRGWTIVGEHLLESRRLADMSPSVRRRPPPRSARAPPRTAPRTCAPAPRSGSGRPVARGGDPDQEFRLHVLAHQPVIAAEGDRRKRRNRLVASRLACLRAKQNCWPWPECPARSVPLAFAQLRTPHRYHSPPAAVRPPAVRTHPPDPVQHPLPALSHSDVPVLSACRADPFLT